MNVITKHIHGVGPVAKVTFCSLSISGKFIEHNARRHYTYCFKI